MQKIKNEKDPKGYMSKRYQYLKRREGIVKALKAAQLSLLRLDI